ncbi:MAG: PhoH family protein [Gammaproteobacteria bacterium]|nr:PhoH family protein [Gammaproteobacteria bacterium]
MTEDSPSAEVTANIDLEPNDHKRLAVLCGPFDQNLRQLEQRLEVYISNRGNAFKIVGHHEKVEAGIALLTHLYEETKHLETLDSNTVHLSLQESGVNELVAGSPSGTTSEIRVRKRTIRPRGPNQLQFVTNMRKYDVNFGVGPAGTGKTYLAVACAVEALESERIGRIVLVRPAVEVGEKLGFLPGDLAQKIDPYLRPLYDALYEMLGTERVSKFIERNVIEIAPLAYMRGRTLNNAFIILDEGQNTTIQQMKMFLTRIGFGSTVAITGDLTQIDLPQGQYAKQSGLVHVLGIVAGIPGLTEVRFNRRDVVRHPVVQRIVEAYEKSDAASKKTNGTQSQD